MFVLLAGVISAQGPYGWVGYYPYAGYNPAYVDGYYDGYSTGYYGGYQDGYNATYYGPYYYAAPVVYSYSGGAYQAQHFLNGGTPYVTQCQAYGAYYPGGVCK